jgi:hypothetical protein
VFDGVVRTMQGIDVSEMVLDTGADGMFRNPTICQTAQRIVQRLEMGRTYERKDSEVSHVLPENWFCCGSVSGVSDSQYLDC